MSERELWRDALEARGPDPTPEEGEPLTAPFDDPFGPEAAEAAAAAEGSLVARARAAYQADADQEARREAVQQETLRAKARDAEREQCARLREQLRQAFGIETGPVAARPVRVETLWIDLAGYVGVALELTHRCPKCGAFHGSMPFGSLEVLGSVLVQGYQAEKVCDDCTRLAQDEEDARRRREWEREAAAEPAARAAAAPPEAPALPTVDERLLTALSEWLEEEVGARLDHLAEVMEYRFERHVERHHS